MCTVFADMYLHWIWFVKLAPWTTVWTCLSYYKEWFYQVTSKKLCKDVHGIAAGIASSWNSRQWKVPINHVSCLSFRQAHTPRSEHFAQKGVTNSVDDHLTIMMKWETNWRVAWWKVRISPVASPQRERMQLHVAEVRVASTIVRAHRFCAKHC